MAEASSFFWGSGGERMTPEEVKRKRRVAELLAKQGSDYSPVQHWTQGAARVAQALVGGWEDRKASEAEKANEAESASLLAGLLSGANKPAVEMPAATPAAAAPAIAGVADSAQPVTAPASFAEVAPRLKADLMKDFGLNEVQAAAFTGNLAHESGGFNTLQEVNPVVPGSRGGFGYAQWTGPRRKDFEAWAAANRLDPTSYEANYGFLKHELANTPEGSVLNSLRQVNDPIAATQLVSDRFLRPGVPGMSSRQKWTQRALTAANEADLPAPGAMMAEAQTGQPGFAIPPGEQPAPAMSPQTFNAIALGERPLDPVFQSEGVAQPWMGTAIPQEPAGPQIVQAPLPPERPADLPAPGAVEAIGQLPPSQPQMLPDLSNTPDGGMRQLQVISEQARQGQPAAPQAPASPLDTVTAAFSGSGAPAAPQSPAVTAVAQAVAQNPGDPLVRAISSPYANEATKKVAMALLLKRIEGENKAPIAVGKDQRLVDPRTGRVILDRDRNASDVRRSLTPVYGTDAQGNTVLLQPSEDGTAGMMKLPPGVKIANGIDKIDTGTEFILQDKRTGQIVGRQAKDLAGAEAAKVEGKAAGEAKVGLGQAIATAEQSLATIEAIRNHPGRDAWGAQGATAAWPIIGSGIPGSKGRDFVVMVDQLKGKAFLEAFESLKGGGQITEQEGAKAQAAIARLDRAQSREGFDAALKDLEDVIRGGVARARAKAGQPAATATAAPPPTIDTTKPGSFRFNPATGKMEPM